MRLKEHPMEWYLDKMRKNEYFAMGMYGDGEWQCIFNASVGEKFDQNCEGTVYSKWLSEKMLDSLRYNEPNFYFSTPITFKKHKDFLVYEKMIDQTLKKLGVDIEFVEKNVWNEEMKAGKLGPLIKELKKKSVCIISNENLRGLSFLNYRKFIEIGYPNCYLDGSLDKAYLEASISPVYDVYIIAAGIPATLLAQRLHGLFKKSFILDLGSIWDGFVGIGAQRSFRANLYKNPDQYWAWRKNNLYGT